MKDHPGPSSIGPLNTKFLVGIAPQGFGSESQKILFRTTTIKTGKKFQLCFALVLSHEVQPLILIGEIQWPQDYSYIFFHRTAMIGSKIPSNNIPKQSLFSSDQGKCQKLVSLSISQLQDMKNVMMQPIMSRIKYKSVEK